MGAICNKKVKTNEIEEQYYDQIEHHTTQNNYHLQTILDHLDAKEEEIKDLKGIIVCQVLRLDHFEQELKCRGLLFPIRE